MKKIIVMMFILVLSVSIYGCGSTQQSNNENSRNPSTELTQADKKTQSVSLEELSISVPSNWRVTDSDGMKYVYPEYGGLLYIDKSDDVISSNSNIDDIIDGFIEGIESNGVKATSKPKKGNLDKAVTYFVNIDYEHETGQYKGFLELVLSGSQAYSIISATPIDTFNEHSGEISDIFESIELKNAQSPSIKESKQQNDNESKQDETTTKNTESVGINKSTSMTTSQANALEKAKSYLSYTSFSHDGLVKQLEYEKFSHDDAVYGADNCGADWMEQAVSKAKSYLDYSSFSYDGMIKQLEYEKFTNEQAVHGADNCGADWNEQAAKKAKSYLEYSSFSRDSLVDQLMYEGFTAEQAEYGVSKTGL